MQNPRVQRARKLLRASARRKEGLFLAEGPNAVRGAFASGAMIVDLFVDAASPDTEMHIPEELRPVRVTTGVMQALSDTSTPQGVTAVVEMPDASLDVLPEDASFVLVLAEVRDPGNAGTLIRSALGAGADAVVFTDGSVDPYGPKTVRASVGAIFGLPIAQASLEETADRLRGEGFKVLGTEAGAEPVHSSDLTGKVAFVLGNEAWGIPIHLDDLLDGKVGIPMPGPVESLNVAVAGSLLLFEVARQRAGGV